MDSGIAYNNSLPMLLKEQYLKRGEAQVAMRVKDRGIWQSYSWREYYEKVKFFCLGLVNLGLKRGDKVSILGENKPEWYWAELASLSAGATAVGIFTDCVPSEIKFYVQDSDSTFVIVHDQEQVDKILEIKEELPKLQKLIFWDHKGLWFYDDPIMMGFDDVIALGREYDQAHPDIYEKMVSDVQPEDIAVICYTSGTTGLPKGAMLSHGNIVAMTRAWLEVDDWQSGEQYLSFLPPAWVTEQALGITGSLISGMEVNFPEDPETVQANIREVGPGVLFYGPRLWESVVSMIQAKITDTSPFRRFLYHFFLPVGYRRAKLTSSERNLGLWLRFLFALANFFVFRALKDRVGLSNIRCAYTAGSAISPDILRYFQAIGVNIKQLYGGSEQGLVSIHRDGDIKWETSGPAMPGIQIKLSDEGEILVKGPNTFVGYYKKEEAYKKKVTDGWYHTEDFGHLDEDNHLVVIDRMEDLKDLRGGQKFSPQFIEIRLRFSPYIKDALVIGSSEHDFVSTIINIDMDNVGRWAEKRHIAYTTFTDLSQKPEVIQLIREELEKVNRSVPEHSRVKKFLNLHKEFDADESELTRTRKLRRTFVEEKYGAMIEAIYGDKTEYRMEESIKYRDGRTGKIENVIKVNQIEG